MTARIFGPALAAIALYCLGCGQADDGVERYNVSGAVTISGRPVESGQIIFQPDAAAGNSGAPAFAAIRGGKYDTRKDGKGTIGGPHVVRIEAREPGADGKEVQITWETKADLPQKAATQNFEIPAEAAKTVEAVEPP